MLPRTVTSGNHRHGGRRGTGLVLARYSAVGANAGTGSRGNGRSRWAAGLLAERACRPEFDADLEAPVAGHHLNRGSRPPIEWPAIPTCPRSRCPARGRVFGSRCAEAVAGWSRHEAAVGPCGCRSSARGPDAAVAPSRRGALGLPNNLPSGKHRDPGLVRRAQRRRTTIGRGSRWSAQSAVYSSRAGGTAPGENSSTGHVFRAVLIGGPIVACVCDAAEGKPNMNDGHPADSTREPALSLEVRNCRVPCSHRSGTRPGR